ncbi:ferric reductase-like transmembrane domain-containing protein [Streptomyces sp. SID12501]|uniref:Cytochrome b/b6 domain-containing protein n=1 Tax=Streptomyces sp. SID12501 TaxID=2706042 RepID=A0A6B3C585_9ACTN|nr:ferric reductase-like transmembrane domain-containing protein [Streptomyces sp. SID12501]NEC91945.1 cytochrome b/b6 domain-containing protein [Streptomyces sp. SID12501]
MATAAMLLLIPVVVLVGGDTVQDFLNFGAGVLSLVALSCSVIWGLVATDRVFLNTRQRLIAQAVHRTTAVSSVAFLLLHVSVKLALDHVTLIAALIPFSLGVTGTSGLIGMGSMAGLLMIFTAVTGALRSRFASPAPVAARWRAMHMLAYPAWCFALVHGLYAGRQAKPVFTILYSLCLVAVIAALALRSAPRPFKRKVAAQIMAILGSQERMGREGLDASRARLGESSLPGYENPSAGRPARGDAGIPTPRSAPSAAPLYDAPASRTMTPEPAQDGFAAAYRAVTPPPRAQDSYMDQTARMDIQSTEAMPRMDGSTSGSWPIPSPPPLGEAPVSAYDPMNDTGYNIPVYGNPGAAAYNTGDVYNTGESNAAYGTYNANDTYNSGPATDTNPGASYDFDAPGSGEPWNAPSGGFK